MLRTPRLMTLTAPALLAGALALGGCQSPPKIDVEVQWADAMGRLNMFATAMSRRWRKPALRS